MNLEFSLNGKATKANVRSGDRLSAILFDADADAGVHADCLSGHCGRCLVLMDGRLVYSCLMPAFKAKDADIRTYKVLKETEDFKDVIRGFQKTGYRPCPFCRTARMMAAADLLSRTALPSEEEIREQLSMVSCACTDPEALVRAVLAAAEEKGRRKYGRAVK